MKKLSSANLVVFKMTVKSVSTLILKSFSLKKFSIVLSTFFLIKDSSNCVQMKRKLWATSSLINFSVSLLSIINLLNNSGLEPSLIFYLNKNYLDQTRTEKNRKSSGLIRLSKGPKITSIFNNIIF